MTTRILIVDDEEPIAVMCANILGIQGFESEITTDPNFALDMLSSQYFDMILVDFRMPGMTGFELLDLARQIRPQIAVVIMTGVNTMETATEALRRGADGLTLKPFTANELIENVRYALAMSIRRQDGQRLHAIRPLFDVTERLFSETDLARLEEFLVRAARSLIACDAIGLFDRRNIDDDLRVVASSDCLQPWQTLSPAETPRTNKTAAAYPLAEFGGVTLCDSPACVQALMSAARIVLNDPENPSPYKDGYANSSLLVSDYRSDHSDISALKDLGFGPFLAKPILFTDPRQHQPPQPAESGSSPIQTETRVLVLLRKAGAAQFQQSDVETFLLLCRQAAAAIENATLNAALQSTISRLQESERNLRETIQNLEVSKQALIQAEKLATAGRLTASIAHEIKNPLQALENCLHIARMPDEDPASRQEYLNLADSELKRLSSIVQGMLNYYRPRQEERRLVDIHALLNLVIRLNRDQITRKRIKIITQFDPTLPELEVVPDQIQQVFLNLLLNALQALENQPAGRLTITTSAFPAPAQRNRAPGVTQVDILFEDNGPGIPEEIQSRLFEPFASTKPEGLGLGLPICYSIITAHGGEISGVSTSQGAVFSISLFTSQA